MSDDINANETNIDGIPGKGMIVQEEGLGYTITVEREDLLKTATGLKEAGFDLFLFVTGVDYPDHIKLVYRIYSTKRKNRMAIIVKTDVPKSDPAVDSMAPLWPAANWHEREAYDLFGVEFKGHPDLRRIFMPEDWVGYPLRKDYSDDHMLVSDGDKYARPPLSVIDSRAGDDAAAGKPSARVEQAVAAENETGVAAASELERAIKDIKTDVLTINFGPQHPSAHGVFRGVFEVDGEIITRIDSHIGYLHRCFEKIAEHRTYTQFIPFTDRMDYLSAMLNNWGYTMSVEKLAEIAVPERAEYLRIIVGELNRIASHLVFLSTAAIETGALTPYFYYFDERERILLLFEQLCGARFTYNYMRIGGVRIDAPEGWFDDVLAFCERLEKSMVDYDKLLLGNYIFKKRMKGVAPFSAEQALSWGLTGPSLRASGVNYDVRKADPYSVYPRIDFDEVVLCNGDNLDRVIARSQEIRQSLKIIEQAVAQIPDGLIVTPDLPRYITPAPGEAYAHIESSRGDLGFFIVSDGSPKPYRVKIQGPSFGNLQALPAMATGCYFSDAVLIFGTLDTVFGEVDR
ncbi:MAG: NADH-quinone oxidoreductase subunit D [Actinobacteria bacterium]|nr:NADH-quinone oxidoreductase subunit D [Actinomycetota bacterium]